MCGNFYRAFALSLLVVMLAILAGCGAKEAAKTEQGANFAVIKDDMGREVALGKKPERIVVLSASFLEPLHAVGGDVVGRPDSKTKMPDYAKDKASVGEVYQIDVEKVLACQPDLVIVNKGMNEKLLSTLEANGIPSIVIDMTSYEHGRKGEGRDACQGDGREDSGRPCTRAKGEEACRHPAQHVARLERAARRQHRRLHRQDARLGERGERYDAAGEESRCCAIQHGNSRRAESGHHLCHEHGQDG